MINYKIKFTIILTFLFSCTYSIYTLEQNKLILFQFGSRNGAEHAIGLYDFSFYEDGLLRRIDSFTNTGISNNPYEWESIKHKNTDYLVINRNENDIKAVYYAVNAKTGKIIKWFKIVNNERILEMTVDGRTETGVIQINSVTGEYTYFHNNEEYGYFHKKDNSEVFYKNTDKEKGLFFQSTYTFGITLQDIKISNTAKRFHPRLTSYDDNFHVVYQYDGKIRYTITRTEDDYPAEFVDKLDLITTLDTTTISPLASVLNSFFVFSPPIGYYTYLHPFVTRK